MSMLRQLIVMSSNTCMYTLKFKLRFNSYYPDSVKIKCHQYDKNLLKHV